MNGNQKVIYRVSMPNILRRKIRYNKGYLIKQNLHMSKVTGAYQNLCINMFQSLRAAEKACTNSIVAQRNIVVCRFISDLNN